MFKCMVPSRWNYLGRIGLVGGVVGLSSVALLACVAGGGL